MFPNVAATGGDSAHGSTVDDDVCVAIGENVMKPNAYGIVVIVLGWVVWVSAVASSVVAQEDAGRDGRAGWSYRPIERPSVPSVRNRSWVANPVDAFVLARLEEVGLEPSPRADRRTLLRRATYDLLGLPPRPTDFDVFPSGAPSNEPADESDVAWSRVVDALLASPHYGEKWGRHWLDLVRYAETNGYERDATKPFVWRYRDYVIRAFNDDVPYDRFVREQLAGDEIDDASADSITATGYYRLMIWDDEPGQGAHQARYDTLADVVATTSDVFLGMSLGCARCHDHKIDPIPQRDYYRFMAFFHGLTDMTKDGYLTDISPPDVKARYDAALVRRDADEKAVALELETIERELERRLAERDGANLVGADLTDLRYRFYRDTFESIPNFEALRPEEEGKLDGGLIDLAPATRRDAIGFVFDGRLTVSVDGRHEFFLAAERPGRLLVDGKVVIDATTRRRRKRARGEIELARGVHDLRIEYVNPSGESDLKVWWTPTPQAPWRWTSVDPREGWEQVDFDDAAWRRGRAGFGTAGTPGTVVGTRWDTDNIWLRHTFAWRQGDDVVLVGHHDEGADVFVNGVLAAAPRGYTTHYRVFAIDEKARAALVEGKNTLAIRCRNSGGGQYVHFAVVPRHALGAKRLDSVALRRRALSVDAVGERAEDLREIMKTRGEEVLGKETAARYRDLEKRRKDIRRRRLPDRVLTPAAQEHGSHVEDMFIHKRGNAATKGKKVTPGFPSAIGSAEPTWPKLTPNARTSGRRRVLADWIASSTNPLTARVMVNRIWQFHFGRGLVDSPNDFGELGGRPTHPKLLDWLAAEFVASGWSVKAMHRLIMRSATYRMTSRANAAGLARDPANHRWWRFEMRRLTAEEVRDSMIVIGGRLNRRVGGPSFHSFMPREVLETSSRPDEVWGRSSEEERARRSVYIKVKRSLLTPVLTDFDLADTDASCAARFVTTQPGQALGLLNGEFARRQAEHFAARLRRETGEERMNQVRLAIKLVSGRNADDVEIDGHLEFARDLETSFGLDADQALVELCLVLLNTNEFVYLD